VTLTVTLPFRMTHVPGASEASAAPAPNIRRIEAALNNPVIFVTDVPC
jgi:hypothetical protein